MADPISATASVLTLLGAAGGTSKFLYNLILDIADAPSEIRAHMIRFECLNRTFSALIQMYSSLPRDIPTDAVLCSRLFEFLEEAEILRTKFQGKAETSTFGIRERCRWLYSDCHLKKFLSSLQQWDMIFTQAIFAIQTTLLLKIKDQTSSPTILPLSEHLEAKVTPMEEHLELLQRCAAPRRSRCQKVSSKTKQSESLNPRPIKSNGKLLASKRLADYLSQVSDPVDLRLRHWLKFSSKVLSLDFRSGRTIVRRWSEDGHEQYTILSGSEAYSIAFTLKSCQHWPFALALVIHGFYKWSCLPSLDLRCRLKFSALIRTDSVAYQAVKTGDLNSLKHIFSSALARPSDATKNGDTLLHVACRYGHSDIARFLLDSGADVNAGNNRGLTPLHLSIRQSTSPALSTHLLHHGANLSHQDVDGRTPLHTFYNYTITHFLQAHRSSLDSTLRDNHGMTIFHYLCWSNRSRTQDIAWVPADLLEPADAQGRGVLHLAVERGNLELINFLLNRNQEQGRVHNDSSSSPPPPLPIKTTPDHHGRTLLHYATESSRVQTIDLLLALGFDMHARDNDGQTLMHHAASRGNVNAMKRLMELGAQEQLRTVDKEGRTPAQLARICRADAVVRFVEGLGKAGFEVLEVGGGEDVENGGNGEKNRRVRSRSLMLLLNSVNIQMAWFLLGFFVATVVLLIF